MSAKSTPGPWRVTDMKHTVGRAVWAGTPGGPNEYRVCGVGLSHVQGQMEANACLIAAAPDLLEALEEIVKNDPFQQSSAGIIARAAIAKAVTP